MDYIKVREVLNPVRANKTDAGIDFFVPLDLTVGEMRNLNKNKITDYQYTPEGVVTSIILQPQERTLIPSGIHCKLPKNHALVAFNKSGVAAKTGLIVGSQVVDEGYEGEIHLSVINTSNKTCLVKAGAKIVQFILMPVKYSQPKLKEVPLIEFYKESTSTRGSGGFGSSNKKDEKNKEK